MNAAAAHNIHVTTKTRAAIRKPLTGIARMLKIAVERSEVAIAYKTYSVNTIIVTDAITAPNAADVHPMCALRPAFRNNM
jgi:hypothetical protein